jgi:hypothetical protein
MDAIANLANALGRQGYVLGFDMADDETGPSWIDLPGTDLCVEVRLAKGYGLYFKPDDGFGTGPDEVFGLNQLDALLARIGSLLAPRYRSRAQREGQYRGSMNSRHYRSRLLWHFHLAVRRAQRPHRRLPVGIRVRTVEMLTQQLRTILEIGNEGDNRIALGKISYAMQVLPDKPSTVRDKRLLAEFMRVVDLIEAFEEIHYPLDLGDA